jgi:glutamate formiminotransferase / formiminotetrahydrofolate cyclodeaminase
VEPILSCVPNFSEGRNPQAIQAIAQAIRQVPGCKLLHVDVGEGANRTVMTFAGAPKAVIEAAFLAIQAAAQYIDMRQHHGAHPRIGATDVCPLVPVSGISMHETVLLAHELGKRVGSELDIPVYLYEEAATRPERRSLASVRQGEYEGYRAKISQPDWVPDYGKAVFNERAGQTVIGARGYLVAYNVNLSTREVPLAKQIAERLRESGYFATQPDGKKLKVAGRLKALRAIGWFMPEFDCAQVSMNLLNYKATGIRQSYEAVRDEAGKMGLELKGSELIGLVPLEAMLEAGRALASPGGDDMDLLLAAIEYLGLAKLKPFPLHEKILEYALERA